MNILENTRVVLCDFDDTLTYTFRAKVVQHHYVARTHYGKELTEDEIRRH